METESEVLWVDLSCDSARKFDDIVNFGGIFYALDTQGKLYQIAVDKFTIFKALDFLTLPACGPPEEECRRRLVRSSTTGKLFLVRKMIQKLYVYELFNVNSSLYQWVKVQSFGDDKQVLFVSKNYCFLASAAEFPGCELSNCIVFSRDAFPRRSKSGGWKSKVLTRFEEEPQVYRLGSNDCFKPVSAFPINLWSPPLWISSDHTPAVSLPQPHRGHIGSKDMPPSVSSSEEGAPQQSLTQNRSAPSPEFRTNTHSVSRAYITSITQSSRSENSTVKFEGLDIRSTLLPTLQSLWFKHGNLVENSTISNGDIIARALESLATAVLILEENSARALSDSQADYLSSTLSDLRCMQFKVDWLGPYVEKAIELHKSKPLMMPLMDTLDTLGHCKTRVAERISKLLEELAQLDKMDDELEEDMANVSKMIPFSGNVDLDKPLGAGLS
ncbi:uncharacterized protein [Spinacia oleracea]|uniref:KIB1-4 beta-propeller domain-containing protein n=1 Tax=Spinacia oleracea TaxID=3562 RepID=A0ABM3QSA0_SPIOL|nr:uncharacterized protein LOC110780263 [Spinacia oleracea]XP_056686251.1 uncharacterized protein LOC110780263 [Spinacia oleracea]XP_056686252.1 uncharacterized protein LOC110780263 [Spinacia oleracea]